MLAGKTLHLGNESESNRIEEIDSTFSRPFPLSFRSLLIALEIVNFVSLSFPEFQNFNEAVAVICARKKKSPCSPISEVLALGKLEIVSRSFRTCVVLRLLCRLVREGEVNCDIIGGNRPSSFSDTVIKEFGNS